jgi:uncharacterized protein with von Willebrand factor type A (vWA) domain
MSLIEDLTTGARDFINDVNDAADEVINNTGLQVIPIVRAHQFVRNNVLGLGSNDDKRRAARNRFKKRMKKLRERITGDETITESTRNELLSDLGSLSLSRGFENITTEGDGLISQTEGPRNDLSLDEIAGRLEAAIAGEGRFGMRQAERTRARTLADQSGRRQTLITRR